ncbi:MAG: electron transport complex subunit RsxG [Candidatus Contendobacter sp.]|nr:electron transport complex subunit RsxG [Candidatus Contendobacter sp.]
MSVMSLLSKENWRRWRERPYYHTLLLGAVALLTGAAISIADTATRSAIAERRLEDLQVTLEQVIPAALHDNTLTKDTVTLRDGNREVIAYQARRGNQVQAVCYEVTAAGYGSTTMRIIIGVDRDGKLLGVRVTSHAETPGLGDKIERNRSNWILSFDGRSLGDPPPERWGVKKDGGIFDQFTGATITPRAVVKAVKGGLEFFAAHRAQLLGEPSAITQAVN